jgi:hypothetical protein
MIRIEQQNPPDCNQSQSFTAASGSVAPISQVISLRIPPIKMLPVFYKGSQLPIHSGLQTNHMHMLV